MCVKLGHEILKIGLLHQGQNWLKVLENRVLRKIFGPKWEEITGDWRKLHEEFYDLYSSPDNTGMIKSRMMR
jgi:hypothetical protein